MASTGAVNTQVWYQMCLPGGQRSRVHFSTAPLRCSFNCSPWSPPAIARDPDAAMATPFPSPTPTPSGLTPPLIPLTSRGLRGTKLQSITSSLRGPCPNSRLPPLHHPCAEQVFQNLHHITNAFSGFHCIPGFHPYAWLGLQGFTSSSPCGPPSFVLLIPDDSATGPLPEFMTPPPLRVFVQHFPPELVLFIPQAQLACPGCELST